LQREETRGVEPSIQPRPPRSLYTLNECGRSQKWNVSNLNKTNNNKDANENQWEVTLRAIQMKTSKIKAAPREAWEERAVR